MQVYSLQVVVPTKKCINKCPCCVSAMHTEYDNPYADQIEGNTRFSDLYKKDYIDRLAFARENGCNTMVITGDGEPLQNTHFLEKLSNWNEILGNKRFLWIELQTTGVYLNDEKLRWLRNTVRVNTIALSAMDIFDTDNNDKIIGIPTILRQDFGYLCSEIKRYDFNLRISVNLTDCYENYSIQNIFARLKELKVDQVLFRTLYDSGEDSSQTNWVRKHSASKDTINKIGEYIVSNGEPLELLPFGARRYSVHGISAVTDHNCMIPQEVSSDYRYLILRQDCKLYSRWEDTGSKIF